MLSTAGCGWPRRPVWVSVLALGVVLSDVVRHASAAGAEVRRTLEPGAVDQTFLTRVAQEPSDLLILLYSPTCPDCQWFMSRWAQLGQRLQKIPSVALWTVADPGFTAPKPFEHWHNPAIFFAPALKKGQPVLLSQDVLGAYLAGNTSRSQDEQDQEFQDNLLDFVGQRASLPLDIFSEVLPEAKKSQGDLEALAKTEWDLLTKRWADTARLGVAPEPVATPSQPRVIAKPPPAKRASPVPRPKEPQLSAVTAATEGRRGPGGCHHTCSKPPWEALVQRARSAAAGRLAPGDQAHSVLRS